MRNTLFTIVITVVLIFGFTGCDSILETLYPEFAPVEAPPGEEPGEQEWFFDLMVFVDIALPADVDPAVDVVGVLRGPEERIQFREIMVEFADKGEPHFFTDFYFGGLPVGWYTVEFFIDLDGDGFHTEGEPLVDMVEVTEPGTGDRIWVPDVGIDAPPPDYRFVVIEAYSLLGEPIPAP